MTYILSLTYPVAYDADDDDHARVIAEHIDDALAGQKLPHGAELLDAPGETYVLEETQPGGESRVVVGDGDFIARYAPFPPGTERECEYCADYVAQSNNPAPGSGGLLVELVNEDGDR